MRRTVRLSLPVAALIGGGTWVVRAALLAPVPIAAPILVHHAYHEVADTLGPDQTLAELFARRGMSPAQTHAMLTQAPQLNPRRMRTGQVFHLRIPFGGTPDRVVVRLSPEERLTLRRDRGEWSTEIERIAWGPQRIRVHGQVGTSLWDALVEDVPDEVLPHQARVEFAQALGDVYAWVIDFDRELREGDRYQVLADRLVSEEGEVRFGRIHAAVVETGGRSQYAFELARSDGRPEFFDQEGRSLRRAFLKSPLQFGRLTSRFGMRRHPILGRWRNHLGIDYAAQLGTEVRATGEGVVTFAGRDGGYGNVVRIRHPKGYETAYAHLRGFARGIRSGVRVEQQQVIGFVGATGLANGPHVHYELRRNGAALNSRRLDLGDGAPVPTARRAEFDSVKNFYLGSLAATPRGAPVVARVDEE